MGQETKDRSLDKIRMIAVSICLSKRLPEIPRVNVTDQLATMKLETDSMTFVFTRPITVSQYAQVSTNSLLHCHTFIIFEYNFKLCLGM